MGDYDAAKQYHERSLDLKMKIGDPVTIANSLTNLGHVHRELGNLAKARSYYEQAHPMRKRIGNVNAIGHSFYNLGIVASREGRFPRAKVLFEDAKRCLEDAGDRKRIGNVLAGTGHVCWEIGDADCASASFIEALRIRESIGDLRGVVECIEEIAILAASCGLTQDATRLLSSATAQRRRLRAPVPPAEQATREKWLRQIEESIGSEMYANISYPGSKMLLARAIEEAVQLASILPTTETVGDFDGDQKMTLTPREITVLQLTASGLTDQQIADTLFIEYRTATTHQSNLRRKLGVQNRSEAVSMASQRGLIRIA